MAITQIPLREVLHFLGWRGTPVDGETMERIKAQTALVLDLAKPHISMRRFALEAGGVLAGTTFAPQGQDVQALLSSCHEAVLLAGTMGAQSERLLLRAQARDAGEALLLDAVLSAAIEAVLDQQEEALRAELDMQGLYLTDRFSPGYGDMPLAQTRSICDVLGTQRGIGLTVSRSGIMIPRKSVTAIMGISNTPVQRRPHGCEGCKARGTCALRRD